MKDIIVGTYECGFEMVTLELVDGYSGYFSLLPKKERGDLTIISVGADYPRFHQVFDVMIHEIDEFCMTRMGLRYSHAPSMTGDTDRFVFMFTHQQFSEKNARVADFIANCQNDLKRAYNKWQKDKKK